MLTYKKGLLPYKQDILTSRKKDLLTNTKNPRQIAKANFTANSCVKFSRQIPTANSQVLNAEYGCEITFCVGGLHKWISKEQKSLLSLKKSIASEIVKVRRLISKAKISNISEISYCWKLSVIQLSSRIGTWYGFNVPNGYLKTKVCQLNSALWGKRKRYWCIEFALPKDRERYDSTWQIFK